MKKIIIPTSKLVPKDLWNVGKLPAVIYPINQEIVFDYLYRQYIDICSSMEVIC